MANKLKYKVPLGEGKSYQYITHLGAGKVGIVYYRASQYALGMVNIHDGSVVWERLGYDTFGGVAVPFCDEKAVYAPVNVGSQHIAALGKQTGTELWTRYLGNGQYNFMVPPVQTEAHIAAASVNSDRLSVIDKKSGKLAGKAKMPHGLENYWPLLRPWHDKFIAIAIDGKNDQWTIDLYDPAEKELFVKTIFRFPEQKGDEGKILLQKVVGDSLYFFTEEGAFYKVNLLSGEVMEKHILPDASRSKYGWDYARRYIHQHNGKLCAIGSFYTAEDDQSHYFVFRYELESGAFSVLPIAQTGNLIQFYEGGAYSLTKKGLTHWDVLGDGSMSEITFEEWPVYIPDGTFENSGESGEQWLITESKLLAIRTEEAGDGEKQGYLYCWEL